MSITVTLKPGERCVEFWPEERSPDSLVWDGIPVDDYYNALCEMATDHGTTTLCRSHAAMFLGEPCVVALTMPITAAEKVLA